jgi:CheY-like chemotaxis protein
MQIVRSLERDDAAMVGWGVRTLLLSCEGENGPLQRRLASLGSKVDVVDELFAALSEVIDDPMGYALLMIDCDCPGVGGLEAALRAVQMMGQTGARVPVILVSSECKTQTFPTDRMAPTVLRAPTSAVSLKVGFEHALRERLFFQAA